MNRVIRSVSLTSTIDNQLKQDSAARGLTVSANLARILYEYYQAQGALDKKKLNLLSTKI